MTWREAMLAAFLATVGRGRWWLTALAAFLVRGGLLFFLPAIVLLPTPADLAARLDPGLTGDAPGAVTSALVELVVRLLVGGAAVLVATTVIGTGLEGALIADAASDEELEPVGRTLDLPLGRATVARLAAHLPTAVAVVAGGVVLAGATYAELLAPSGTGSLVGRVAARAPLAMAAIVLAWLLGESWGGLALRRLAAGHPLAASLGGGLVGVLRPSGLATVGLTTAAVALPAGALWFAAAQGFDRLWPLVVDRDDSGLVAIAIGLLVGTWAAGLWLLGIGLAFRSAAWTAESLRTG